MPDDWEHVELGHAEAVQEALVAKEKLAALQDKYGKPLPPGMAKLHEAWVSHHTASPAAKPDPGPMLSIDTTPLAEGFAAIGKAAGEMSQTLGAHYQEVVVPHMSKIAEQLGKAYGLKVTPYAEWNGQLSLDPVPLPEGLTDIEFHPDGTATAKPTVGTTLTGPDGIVQAWDGTKWVLAVDLAAKYDDPAHHPDESVPDLSDQVVSVEEFKASHGWADPSADPVADIQAAIGFYKAASAGKKGGKATISTQIEMGKLTPEAVQMLFGADLPVSTADAHPGQLEDALPALFDDDADKPASHPSSGLFCTAHQEHWDDPQHIGMGSLMISSCQEAGYVRAALPHEEKAWIERRKALGL